MIINYSRRDIRRAQINIANRTMTARVLSPEGKRMLGTMDENKFYKKWIHIIY